ncbi:MAG: sugar ABC transporter substrate-binding protein [Eubacteriales bacterium]|nr:sugar ABC transporter substrate-binding protein [Eubacteriales bacterium]
MKKKAIVSLMLCAAMVMPTMSVQAAETKEELKFWVFHTDQELEFFQECVDQYNEEQDSVEVVLEQVPWDDYNGTKMATAFASGEGPDVFLIAPGLFLKYANSDVLMPLNDYIAPEVLADFSESSIEGVSVDDKILAIPFEMELLGLYYDKTVFAEEGLEVPATWNELYETAKALTTDSRYGFTMETTKGTHQLFEWYPFLWQTGNDVYTEGQDAAAVNTEGVLENLELKRKMFEEGYANIKPSRPNTEIGMLCEGETAMQLNGSWAISQMKNNYADSIDNIGVAPLPVPEGGEAATVAGGWKICANANSKYADEAAKFAVWMFGDDVDRTEKWCTDIKFAFSPRQSVIEANEELYHEGLNGEFTDKILGTEYPEMRLPAEVSTILQDMLQSAYFDTGVSVEDSVEIAEESLNDFLSGYDGAL